jgi:parvulin-like peptidyl-prolyl isomerase
MHRSASVLLTALATACSNPIATMDAAIAELQARPEHQADLVEVEHVLIAFAGAPRIQGVTRSLAEAKALAADVFRQATGGADFRALRQQHSNDTGPGIYAMTRKTRGDMVPGFGDTGWRLQVGEIGVAPYDATKSPFGYHVIKRLR